MSTDILSPPRRIEVTGTAGVSCWVKAHWPATRVIGVCARGTPAMERSWRAGKVVAVRAETIADGLAVTQPYAEAVADLTGVVDDVVLVDEATLVQAMRLAHRELGVVLEPSGAAGLAASLTFGEPFRRQLVAAILSGGNLTAGQMREWLAEVGRA